MTEQNDEENQEVNQVVDQFGKLPEEEKDRAFVQLNAQVNNYGGMLPNPEALKKYNDMVPGIAEKYFDNVFKESDFRRQFINKQQNSNNKYRMIGLMLGWLFGIIMMGGSIFLLFTGHSVTGGILTGVVLLGGLGIFVTNTNNDAEDKDKK